MIRKKRPIRYAKERCLLSDVLPYETPVTFSNRQLYRFLTLNKVQIGKDGIRWIRTSRALDLILQVLLCLPKTANSLEHEEVKDSTHTLIYTKYRFSPKKKSYWYSKFLVPFKFFISHKRTEFRELCIPHPRSQLIVSEFYDQYKELILYYTSRSEFSIRAPTSVAKYTYNSDRMHRERLNTEYSGVEVRHEEYENLRSFFVYGDYSNIHKFYESYRYHRAEQKYNYLIKLDISKCFDSIYTHSIGWAIFGKSALKQNLREAKGTFPDKFDRIMQHMNHGETNGIIIGPEFSRIFAEIILQTVDCDLAKRLEDRSIPLKHRVNFEIFRYVDDYFIFYNTEEEKKVLVDFLQRSLKEYKLNLSVEKMIEYKKPIITDITIAKQQISKLLNDRMDFREKQVTVEGSDKDTKFDKLYIKADSLITAFKTIIKTCNVEYKEMLNYTLSIVEKKCVKLFDIGRSTSSNLETAKERIEITNKSVEDHDTHVGNNKLFREICRATTSILEFTFFIYSVSPRVNTTIRLCRILERVNVFLKNAGLQSGHSEAVKKIIFDNIGLILEKNKSSEARQIETLYLLTALSELGRDYLLEQRKLAEYAGVKMNGNEDEFESAFKLNYFSITVLLHYMRKRVRYKRLQAHIVDLAIERIRESCQTCNREAELVFLLFDLLACPYIDVEKKTEALTVFGLKDIDMVKEVIEFLAGGKKQQLWFTNWRRFNFAKELDAKRSLEVY